MPDRRLWLVAVVVLTITLCAPPAQAMHISEGILPAPSAAVWFAAAAPFVVWGLIAIRLRRARQTNYMPTLAMVGAAVFLISCMPIPIPGTGSCSHPCGTALAAIIVGPAASIVVATLALLFQALFMAHGGLTTLGANVVSMGVIGSLTGWAAFQVVRRLTGSAFAGAVAAGLLGDWATYAATSFILASALHGGESMWPMFLGIAGAFTPTQIPLGVLEGALTGWAYRFIARRRPELISPQLSARGTQP